MTPRITNFIIFAALCLVMSIACLWAAIQLFKPFGLLAVLVAFVVLSWPWRLYRDSDLDATGCTDNVSKL